MTQPPPPTGPPLPYSGIRPGEKLSEKLFFDHERDVPTKSRLIHRARLAIQQSFRAAE